MREREREKEKEREREILIDSYNGVYIFVLVSFLSLSVCLSVS